MSVTNKQMSVTNKQIPLTYKHIFNLQDNFTKEQLKNSYLIKINEIKNNTQMNNIDKQFWLQQLYHLYIQGKHDLSFRQFNNNLYQINNNNFNQISNSIFSHFNNLHQLTNNNLPGGNSVGYYKSYKSVTGNDGITHVQETNKFMNNDKIKSQSLAYKIDKDGKKFFFNPNQIKSNTI